MQLYMFRTQKDALLAHAHAELRANQAQVEQLQAREVGYLSIWIPGNSSRSLMAVATYGAGGASSGQARAAGCR